MSTPSDRGAGGGHGGPYWPALDGVRGLAILTVIAYHLGHLPGGWVSLDVFFVMSGYLITSLLLRDRDERGTVVSARFWGRRARRLLPAVFTLLAFLGLYAWAGGPGLVGAQLRGPALATFFYAANWQQLAAGHDYFAQFTAPSPLTHTWSLAIEEQYYVIWPLLLAGVLTAAAVLRRRRNRGGAGAGRAPGTERRAAVVVGILVLASAAWMGLAAHLFGANRTYLGTDTRAWELLLGSGAALWWRGAPGRRERRAWSVAAAVGAVALVGFVAVSGGPPGWVWDGGLAGAGVASLALIVGSVRAPDGPASRALSWGPLRWVGRVSYSLYLWHWPVIVLMTPATTGLAGAPLLLARLAAMLAATCASFYLIENPLRRADWSAWRRRALAPVAAGATAAVLVAGTVTPAAAGAAAVRTPPASARPSVLGVGLPPGRAPTAADPLRVWVFGDSVMHDSEAGLAAALRATGSAQVVADSSFGGWGLSTDRVWPADARRIISQYRPEVVIGTWSWDDELAAGTPAAYSRRLHAALATILAPGDGVDAVVLLGYPPAGPTPNIADPALRVTAWRSHYALQSDWDRLAARMPAQFPGKVAYLATTAAFAPGGRVMTWMRTATGGWIRARKLDNTHMCPYGAALLGALVVSAVQGPLHLPPMHPGWESGAWTRDVRFNDPPGACPADQPPSGYRGVALPVLRA